MATIYQMDQHLTVDQKWEVVKNYYEMVGSTKAKKIKISRRPSTDQIEDLYEKIGQFNLSAKEYFVKKPGCFQNFVKSNGLMPEHDPILE